MLNWTETLYFRVSTSLIEDRVDIIEHVELERNATLAVHPFLRTKGELRRIPHFRDVKKENQQKGGKSLNDPEIISLCIIDPDKKWRNGSPKPQKPNGFQGPGFILHAAVVRNNQLNT